MTATKDKPLIPPDDSLWQKYSAHFELPLAGATSIFLHGLAIGVMVIVAVGLLFAPDLEATKPPSMDVVMIEGGGSGFEGLGGEQGSPGDPEAGGPKRTEQITPLDPVERVDKSEPPRLLKDPPPELGLPLIEAGNPAFDPALTIELQKIAQDADEEVRKQMKLPAPPSNSGGAKPGVKGSGNPKGVGGLGGKGGGVGKGSKKGPGVGSGGLGGRAATQAEIYAWRWHFDLAGDAKEHARKLAAIGVTVAFQDPRGGFVVVTDLNRRPVEMKRDNLAAFKDAVKWYNTKPESVQALSRELRLPFVPRFVVLLLPKDREKRMADEEARFATEERRDLKNVRKTWFDFRLRDGAYDPVALRME